MKAKRKRHNPDTLVVLLLWIATLLFFGWLCAISTYYQFDGIPPCSVPEAPACVLKITQFAPVPVKGK